jgi:hypothetical protein
VPNSTYLTSVVNPVVGDGWITANNGHLWVFVGPSPNDNISKWNDVGMVRGPTGPQGPPGPQGPAEVFVGPDTPVSTEVLWVDTDTNILYALIGVDWVPVSSTGGTDEVWIGPDDPISAHSSIELWYDTDDDYTAVDQANFWNSAWGQLGEAYSTTSAVTINTDGAVLTELTVSCTVASINRRIAVICNLGAVVYTRGVANSRLQIFVARDGVNLARIWDTNTGAVGAAPPVPVFATVTDTPTVGSHTYTIKINISGAGDSVAFNANATGVPRVLTVTDIGPLTRAAVNPPAGQPQIAAAGNALGVVAVGTFLAGNPKTLTGNTLTQISNSLPVTLLAGRKYRIHVEVRAMVITSAGTAGVACWVRDGTNDLTASYASAPLAYTNVAPGYNPFTYHFLMDGDGVARNLNVVMQPNTAVSLNVFLDNCYFYVEDVGPNTAPALPIPDTPQGWTSVSSFLNGWSNFGGWQMAQYRKIGDEVRLRGLVAGGTFGATVGLMFYLPVGFRPPLGEIFGVDVANSVQGRVEVQPDGRVIAWGTAASGSNAYLSLSGIVFSVTP